MYIDAAPAETKGTMGKYDPNMGGVGMGPKTGPGVPVVFWPTDATLVLGAWCLVLGACFSLFGGWPDHSGLVTP